MIFPLPFDTSLFNYPVGKITIEDDWNEQEFLKSAKDFQLVYLFTEEPLGFSSPSIKLVDTKITFQKNLSPLDQIEDIRKFNKPALNDELIELAYLSGIYSRFKTDPRLQNQEFEKLYKLWINKAFENQEILIAPEQAGMVTYSVDKDMGAIGLIAVSENHQGKGWGRKLVQAAENKALHAGAKKMQIPTQETNIPACKLYQSLGYTPAEIAYVYHWWKG
mgnify:FL=1